MDNILDHVVVQGQRYDIVSPTAFGDYIETIGSACINPDGYAQGSTFLARLGNEQFYYEATLPITQGSAISEGTNCKKTTVTGRESELASDIQTLSNQIEAVAENGAVNLLPNNATSQVINGVTFTVNSDRTVTVSGTATATSEITIAEFYLDARSYKFSGTPSGGSLSTYFMYHNEQSVGGIQTDVGSGATFTVQNAAHKQYVKIQIASGTAITTPITFKPMITLADQPNSDYAHYVPYAMTNRELTDAVNGRVGLPALIYAGSTYTGFFTAVKNAFAASGLSYAYLPVFCTSASMQLVHGILTLRNDRIAGVLLPYSQTLNTEYFVFARTTVDTDDYFGSQVLALTKLNT